MDESRLETDNKFAIDCEIKIEACRDQVYRLEMEIYKVDKETLDIKLSLLTLVKLMKFLRSSEAKIVSLPEFTRIRSERNKLIQLVKAGDFRVRRMWDGIKTLNKEVERLETIKESVRFKLLEFRGQK